MTERESQPLPIATPPTCHEILRQLLELTPEPHPDAAAEQLLTGFEAIVDRRAEVLAHIVPPLRLTDAERPLLRELERRQLLWQDALAGALRMIGEQRHATLQLRAYAPSP